MKTFMLTSAIVLTAATAGWAQQAAEPPAGAPAMPAPEATAAPPEDAGAGPSGTTTLEGQAVDPAAPRTDAGMAAPSAQELTGATVLDASGETIGTVTDLEVDGDAVTAVLIDVGAYIGGESKIVHLPIDAFHVARAGDGSATHIEASVTRAELEAMDPHQD